MRWDYDYVAMGDYIRDTNELADQAAAIAAEMDAQKRKAEDMLWAAVRAAGGKLKIPRSCIVKGKPEAFQVWVSEVDDSVVLEILQDQQRTSSWKSSGSAGAVVMKGSAG